MLPRFRLNLTLNEWLSAPLHRGHTMASLEAAFAQELGYPHAVYFPYARTAVSAYLETIGVKQRKVVFSPLNCIALAQGVTSAGAIPRYVDSADTGFNQNEEIFVQAMGDPQVAAGIVVSLWGTDLDLAFSQQIQQPLLYDFALRGLSPEVPTLKSSDAVVYSLSWGKPLSAFKGAMLCGVSEDAARAWRSWRDVHLSPARSAKHWIEAGVIRAGSSPLFFSLATALQHTGLVQGLLGKTNDLPQLGEEMLRAPAAWTYWLGEKRVRELPSLRAKRKEQVARYRNLLSPLVGEIDLPEGDYLSHFPIRLDRRDLVHQRLMRQGVFTSHRLYEKLLCDYPAFTGENFGKLTRARALVETTLHLPLYHNLSARLQEYVAAALKRALHPTRKEASPLSVDRKWRATS